MSHSNSSDVTNVVYEEYIDGPDGPRRSRRLQGISPTSLQRHQSNANAHHQQPGFITPHETLTVPRHPHHQPTAALAAPPPDRIAPQQIAPSQNFAFVPAPQNNLGPYHNPGQFPPPPPPQPLPPPPPVEEVQMVQDQPASRPPRRLEFQQQQGDARSHQSEITYQGALGTVQPGFIDTRSLPPGTEIASWPMRNTNTTMRYAVNNEVVQMQNQMHLLKEQVNTTSQNVGSIQESSRHTDDCLQAINETNRSMQQAFMDHRHEFRDFVRTDLGAIIQGHLKAASSSSQLEASSSRGQTTSPSTNTSVFVDVPPPSTDHHPAPSLAVAAPHHSSLQAAPSATASVPNPAATAPVIEPAPAPAEKPIPAHANANGTNPSPSAPINPAVADIVPEVVPAPAPVTTTATITQPDLATMFQSLINGMDKKEKLTLPMLKKANKGAHRTWKEEAMVALELHPSFQSYVEVDINKYKSIKTSLPHPLRTKLYMALTKCLDQVIKTDIGIDGSITDGYEILQKLERKYGFRQKSELNRLSLVSALDNVKKDPKERISAYTLRFKNAHEECRMNGVLALPPSSITLLYMKNLRTACLTDIILNMSQNNSSEWTTVSDLDALREKVEYYVEEYDNLQSSLPQAKAKAKASEPAPAEQSSNGNPGGSDEEWNKRMRRLCGGLRDKTEEQQVSHLCNLVKQRSTGCFLHDNDHHTFLKCSKLRKICEKDQHNCVAAIAKAKAKIKAAKASTSSTPAPAPAPAPTPATSNDDPAQSYARRVTEALETQQAKFVKAQKKQARREKRMNKQMEETTKFMRAMHMTMANPAAAQGVRPIWTAEEVNPFAHLNTDTDTDDDDSDDNDDKSASDDNNDEAEQSEEAPATDDNTSNDDVSPYSLDFKPSSPKSYPLIHTCHPEHIVGSCRKSSLPPTTSTMVVDSGATAHMDNNESFFEYVLPVTTTSGKPVFVQQGDGTNLAVAGMGPVTKIINNKYKIRYMSYLIPSLSCPLYSVKQHMDSAGCYFHAEGGQAILAFPDHLVQLTTNPEIQFTATAPSLEDPLNLPSFNYETTPSASDHGSFQAHIVKTPYYDPTFTLAQQSTMATSVPFVLKSVLAKLPERKSNGAVGYDTTSIISTIIEPGKTIKIPTGLSCAIPKGMYMRLATRSSHAVKGITVEGGVIDNDFRGEIQVLLHNSSTKPFHISAGDRVAQMIFECAETPYLVIDTTLSPTIRDNKGFGSTNRPQRKRRLIPTTTGLIYLDESKQRGGRGRRVARPITTGLNHPPPQEHYSDTENLWTSESLNVRSEEETHSQLYQKPMKEQPLDIHTEQSTAVPRPQPQTRVNNADPKAKTMTQDHLLQSIGFIKPKSFLRNLEKLGLGTMKVSHLDRNPSLSPGETASMKSSRSSKIPTTVRDKYSDLWHMDIGYGPCAALGGVKYTLLFVDNASRYKYVYPLKNLKSSLLSAVKRFFKDVKVKPKLIRTDFDNKLIHGDVRAYIEDTKGVDLEASPPYRQHENGLVERAWQSLVTMTRNWLTASLLPTNFWWFGIKRSVEISNIMPTNHIPNRVTTPHEIVFGKKVD